jgi:hypothetical protein
MAKKNANFEFNLKSGAYRERLSPEARAKFDELQRQAQQEKATLESDYVEHRDARVAEAEGQLTQTYELRRNMPRPKNVPAPRLPTADEIRNEARSVVESTYRTGIADIDARHDAALEGHVRKELNLPSDADAEKDARHAAYIERFSSQNPEAGEEEGPSLSEE